MTLQPIAGHGIFSALSGDRQKGREKEVAGSNHVVLRGYLGTGCSSVCYSFCRIYMVGAWGWCYTFKDLGGGRGDMCSYASYGQAAGAQMRCGWGHLCVNFVRPLVTFELSLWCLGSRCLDTAGLWWLGSCRLGCAVVLPFRSFFVGFLLGCLGFCYGCAGFICLVWFGLV